MQIKPLHDNVVVEAMKKEEKTASGIVLPETAGKERPEQGVIVAIGPGKMVDGKPQLMQVQVGQKVIFKKYGPDEIKVDGKEFLMLSESDILAIIE